MTAAIRIGRREYATVEDAVAAACRKVRRGSEVFNAKTGEFEPIPPLTITVPHPPADFEVCEFEVDGEVFGDFGEAVGRWLGVGSDGFSLFATDGDGDTMTLDSPQSPDGWEE